MDRRRFLAVGGASFSALLLETACNSEERRRGEVTQEGFDLIIQIGGLCLLVPDPDPLKKRLYVLMPATSGRHGKMRETDRGCEGPVQEHEPLLGYKRKKDDDYQYVTFNDPELDLTTLGTGEPELNTITSRVLNLTEKVIEKRVRRSLITSHPPQRVRCLVTFATGKVVKIDQGAVWEIEQQDGFANWKQPMATDLYWSIEMPGSSLPAGKIHPNIPALTPYDVGGRRRVEVVLAHAPKSRAKLPDPYLDEPAYDFEGYYTLFDERLKKHPLPVFRELTPPFHNPRCILAQAAIMG